MKLNTPNKLIILRFGLALIVIVLLSFVPLSMKNDFSFLIGDLEVSWLNVIALLLFVIASYTDYLDGHLARKNNQITTFGKFFDPLADKILVNSVLVFFAAYSYVPVWIVVLFIVRDIMVDGLRMSLSSKGKVLAAQKSGKYKTAFQMIGISILFLIHSPLNLTNNSYLYNSYFTFSLVPIFVALYFSLYSGFKYYFDNYKELLSE